MPTQDKTLESLLPLEAAGLANQPAKLTEFFLLAAKSLSNFSLEAIEDGIQAVITTSEFFPRIASLVTAVRKAELSGHRGNGQAMRPEILRARATQHLADKNPMTWTDADHAEFERWFGHPVFWKGAPIDSGERCPKCDSINVRFLNIRHHECEVTCSDCGYQGEPTNWVFYPDLEAMLAGANSPELAAR